jgi:WD40 repeat protein
MDRTARVWNAATGRLNATMTGHSDQISSVSFSSDGTQVVTASADDTARIWNAVTGQPIATLTGHTYPVRTASFSPDGTRVVTASLDETARIWASGGDFLQSRVRALTPRCLPAEFRKSTLGESEQEAKAYEDACKLCVPQYFSRLKGVPTGDWKHYLADWKEYQRCIETEGRL